jgi:hypothetical protein
MPGKNSNRIRILFLAANPRATERLDLDREVARIKNRLSDSRLRDRFDLQQEWAVRLDELSRFLLDYRPHIVHFSGHGSSTGELVFEDAAGSGSESAPRVAIANLFRILKDDVRLVVLNACFSQKQARAIAKHIDCVIGTSAAIGDQVAITFAGGFYRAIGFDRDVKTAFELGCSEIELKSNSDPAPYAESVPIAARPRLKDHLIPQLVTRDGVDPSKVILHSGEASPTVTKGTKVSVLEDADLSDTEADEILGAKVNGEDSLSDLSEVNVLGKAKVKHSKLQNITGLDFSKRRSEADR